MSARAREALVHFACAVLPGAACTVYLPALIYGDNADHFATSFLGLIAWLALPAAISAATLGASTFWLPERPRGWARTAFLATFLWVPVSASVFQERFALDGEATIVEADPTQRWIALAVVGTIWAGLLALAHRLPAVVGRFATFAAVGMAGMVIYTAIVSWDGRSLTPVELSASYSRDKNVVVLVLDKLQGEVFAGVLEKEPALAGELRGFTWYPRTKAVARSTYLSLPAMHTGSTYEDGQPLGEWFHRSIAEKSFVNLLADGGFDTTVVYPVPELSACPERTKDCIDGATVGTGLAERRRNEAQVVLQHALLQVAPGPAKAWFAPDEAAAGEEDEEDEDGSRRTGIAAAVIEGNVVLDALAARVTADAPRPTFRMVHVLSTHSPIVADAQCNYRPGGWTRDNATGQARCAFRKVRAWLRALDAAGVYDNTAIVVLSDHGGGFTAPGKNQAVGYANAFLMVKPAGATGDLATSDRPTSLRDVGATVCALSGACTAPNGQDVTGPTYVPEATPFHSFEFRGARPDAMGPPADELFRIGDRPDDFRTWERVSGSVPCDGSASFDWKVRGLTTFGVGWDAFTKVGRAKVRKAKGARSELFLCMGDGGAPTAVEIAAAAGGPAWVGSRVDVLLDGDRIGDFELSARTVRKASVALPPAFQPGRVHHVALVPQPKDGRIPSGRTVWGAIARVAMQ